MSEDEVARWRERALAAERWRDEAWAPLQELVAKAQERDALAERVAQIEGSLSWRLTAPLRALAAAWRSLKARLGLR